MMFIHDRSMLPLRLFIVSLVLTTRASLASPLPLSAGGDVSSRSKYAPSLRGLEDSKNNQYMPDLLASESPSSLLLLLDDINTQAPSREYTEAPADEEDDTNNKDEQQPCNLQASIQCTTENGMEDCDDLHIAAPGKVCGDPSDTTNGFNLQSLSFVYTGTSCGTSNTCKDIMEVGLRPETVLIKIATSTLSMRKQVGVGDILEIAAKIAAEDLVSITIETIETDGRPGEPIQVISGLQFLCNGNGETSVVLGQRIGGLQVISFANDWNGYHSLRETLELIYVVKNKGTSTAQILTASANQNNLLIGKRMEDGMLRPGEELRFSGRTVEIDTSNHAMPEIIFSIQGRSLDSGADTSAGGVGPGIGSTDCFDSTLMSII